MCRNNIREVTHAQQEHCAEELPHVANPGDPNGIGNISLFSLWRFYHSDDNMRHVALLTRLNCRPDETIMLLQTEREFSLLV